ncbi:MAG: hypothetical protein K8T89_03590 [Planctomycetes bacterium]|nr:hypothetical protein [Planctomycetota bacterium]
MEKAEQLRGPSLWDSLENAKSEMYETHAALVENRETLVRLRNLYCLYLGEIDADFVAQLQTRLRSVPEPLQRLGKVAPGIAARIVDDLDRDLSDLALSEIGKFSADDAESTRKGQKSIKQEQDVTLADKKVPAINDVTTPLPINSLNAKIEDLSRVVPTLSKALGPKPANSLRQIGR